jgi:hypothetical protein
MPNPPKAVYTKDAKIAKEVGGGFLGFVSIASSG